LVLLDDEDVALRLHAPDLLAAGGTRRHRLDGRSSGRTARGVAVIVDGQGLALQRRVALHEMDVAREGRDLVAVADLERIRVDLHGLIAILRKALQRIERPARLLLLPRPLPLAPVA